MTEQAMCITEPIFQVVFAGLGFVAMIMGLMVMILMCREQIKEGPDQTVHHEDGTRREIEKAKTSGNLLFHAGHISPRRT